ncbi:MAG TPA: MFS transporter [Candidatus Binataceae bacterium]|nr:MFS transporter [Candidatus Binataceae bacterium]
MRTDPKDPPANPHDSVEAFSAEQLKPIARRNSLILATVLGLAWAGRQLLPTFGGIIAVQLSGMRGLGGAMFAVLMLSTATGAWQGGKWMDRAGRRPALTTAFLVAALGALLVGASLVLRSFALALLGSTVMGYGTGVGQLARLAAADMYPVRQRARAVSYVLMGAAVGTIIGPMATAALEKWATARSINPIIAPWFVFPIAYIVGILPILMLRPDPRTIAMRIVELDSETRAVMRTSGLRTKRELLRMRPVWAAIIAIAALETTMVMIMAIVPLGMADLGYSLPLISTLIAVHFVGMFALSIPAGWIADRVGRKPVLLSGCLVSALGCLMISSGSAVLLVGGGFYCVGLGWSLTYLTATTILSDVTHPYERAGLIGIMDFVVAIGGASSALIGGEIYALGGLVVLGLAGLALTIPPFLSGLRLKESRVGVYQMTNVDTSSESTEPTVEYPEPQRVSSEAGSPGLPDRLLKRRSGPTN